MGHIGGIRRFVCFADALCFLFCCISISFAEGDKPQSAQVVIEKIALFKNGLAFAISSAELPGDAQTVRIGQLPVPSFGTFWIGYPKDVKLQSVVTSMEDLEREDPVQSIDQLLLTNIGRKVLVHTSDRDIEGTILPAANPKGQREPASPYVMSPRQLGNPNEMYIPANPSGNIVLMKTERGTVALSPGSVLRAEFTDGEPISMTRHTQKCPSMFVKLEKPADGGKLSVSYLARGITWIPGYLVDLSDPTTAKFSAHAIVVNELTDLNNVKLQLVTGFPNIKFSDILNPIAKSQSLAEFLSALSGSGGRQASADYRMMQQAVMVNAPGVYAGEESEVVPGYSTAAEGEVAEDLYFYPTKNFTLKKDETAWIPLFTAEMPYKHIYTWRIKDFVDSEDHYRAEAESQDRRTREEIWHSCRLSNTLTMPLTTAAAQFAFMSLMNLLKPFRRLESDFRSDNVWVDFVALQFYSNLPKRDPDCFCCGCDGLLNKAEGRFRLGMPSLGRK